METRKSLLSRILARTCCCRPNPIQTKKRPHSLNDIKIESDISGSQIKDPENGSATAEDVSEKSSKHINKSRDEAKALDKKNKIIGSKIDHENFSRQNNHKFEENKLDGGNSTAEDNTLEVKGDRDEAEEIFTNSNNISIKTTEISNRYKNSFLRNNKSKYPTQSNEKLTSSTISPQSKKISPILEQNKELKSNKSGRNNESENVSDQNSSICQISSTISAHRLQKSSSKNKNYIIPQSRAAKNEADETIKKPISASPITKKSNCSGIINESEHIKQDKYKKSPIENQGVLSSENIHTESNSVIKKQPIDDFEEMHIYLNKGLQSSETNQSTVETESEITCTIDFHDRAKFSKDLSKKMMAYLKYKRNFKK